MRRKPAAPKRGLRNTSSRASGCSGCDVGPAEVGLGNAKPNTIVRERWASPMKPGRLNWKASNPAYDYALREFALPRHLLWRLLPAECSSFPRCACGRRACDGLPGLALLRGAFAL